jgi:hypothetical protein
LKFIGKHFVFNLEIYYIKIKPYEGELAYLCDLGQVDESDESLGQGQV